MENNQQFKGKISDQINYTFNARKLLGSFVVNWYWFLLSIMLFCVGGYLYIRYTTPVYAISSSLLIDSKEKDISSSLLNKAEALRGRDDKSNMFNEMFVLQSKDLIKEVVDSLNLNVQYWVKGRVKETEIYEESPIKLVAEFKKPLENSIELSIRQGAEGQFNVTYGKETKQVLFDSWVNTAFGRYKVLYVNTPYVNKVYLGTDIRVVIEPTDQTAGAILSNYKVTSSDGRTSMLELSYKDNLPRRGVDFMNALINIYT